MARPKKTSTSKENFNQFDRFNSRERIINFFRKELGSLADFYGFSKIHTSPLESHRFFSPLVKSGVLDDRSLAVCKNKAGDFISLRYSGVFSALRSYAANKLSEHPHPLKTFVDEECFLYQNRDGSNFSVYTDFSLLMFGEASAVAEAEIFQVLWQSLKSAGFPSDKVEVKINGLGCRECRPTYRSTLSSYLRSRLSRLCKDCKKELKTSPTNIFSCEEEKCKIVAANAPAILDFLCDACKKYLRELLEFMDEMAIPYLLDGKFFKTKSIYNKIVWEIWASGGSPEGTEGDNSARRHLLGEGGGLSAAFETLNEKPLEVFSGTVFVENLEKFVFQEKISLAGLPARPHVFIIQLGELAKRKVFSLLERLRKAQIAVGESLSKDAIKSQLKSAETAGAEIALILGQKEALDKTIIVRDIQSGMQETIPQEKLVEFLKKKING